VPQAPPETEAALSIELTLFAVTQMISPPILSSTRRQVQYGPQRTHNLNKPEFPASFFAGFSAIVSVREGGEAVDERSGARFKGTRACRVVPQGGMCNA